MPIPPIPYIADPKENRKLVLMGKYEIDLSENGIIGKGASSICRKGRIVKTGKPVAIKVYKVGKSEEKKRTGLTKLKRSIEVLQKLQEPFQKPSDSKLWNDQLETVQPSNLFMQLLDYSKDAAGEPGYDKDNGKLYVVTELAQYSLKDFLSERKKVSAPLSKETVRSIANAIVVVMAGLHAKGFVHLDMKPANLMFFNGCLKLIDVDGCVPIGTHISADDLSISFSPVYCAPEWASFVVGEQDALDICVLPGLDTWSVGCTICELVTLGPILVPAYKRWVSQFGRGGEVRFMDSLAKMEKAPVPAKVQQFDDELVELMTNCLLVCPQSQRRTCAESLDTPYLQADKLQRTKSNPIRIQAAAYAKEDDEEERQAIA